MLSEPSEQRVQQKSCCLWPLLQHMERSWTASGWSGTKSHFHSQLSILFGQKVNGVTTQVSWLMEYDRKAPHTPTSLNTVGNNLGKDCSVIISAYSFSLWINTEGGGSILANCFYWRLKDKWSPFSSFIQYVFIKQPLYDRSVILLFGLP